MEKKLKILRNIVTIKTNVLGDNIYNSKEYSFYDFQNLVELNTEDYENLLKDMRHEGLIEINLNGYTELRYARIRSTNKGCTFLIENS